MKIKSINIKNFKSIVDITINEPNPFTVFVGPNGSGKSNIFEALEFSYYNFLSSSLSSENEKKESPEYVLSMFGGKEDILNFKKLGSLTVNINAEQDGIINLTDDRGFIEIIIGRAIKIEKDTTTVFIDKGSLFGFFKKFIRIFIGNKEKQRINYSDGTKLSFSCDNLEKVLKRLLENPEKREKISEWLELFIPEFDRIEVQKSEFSSDENLLIYQKHYKRPFNKELISDGTYNIIALLTAVYQSDEPQFLCIEEPENGLNPYVIRKLVDFFRNACTEKRHYIWLNTHSQTLVECLEPEEIIVVDKINGETQIKQIKGMNLHGLDMAEVWLSGALGGGTPW
ncbi:MAG: AAA family ATPase [Spirosomataceae bacterium]